MADVAVRLRDGLAALRADGPPAGRAWCRAWADAVDAGLSELATDVAGVERFAVVAAGGYGRRELCPGSDIDVLLLHDGGSHEVLEELVRTVVYPLWDAGLKVGHAVRDRREAVTRALADVDTTTATLDARTVTGDEQLLRDVRDDLVRRLQRRPARFLDALAVKDDERRARVGDAAEVLEPDLKTGAGGLRDVQSLVWAAAALVGDPGLDPLVSARYLGAPDRAHLARSYERLLAVRVALHLEAERPTDVLRLDLQQGVADRLGLEAADDRTGAHRLLHRVFLDARSIDHVHRRARTLLAADARRGRRLRRRPATAWEDGFGIVDGVLTLDDAPDDPALPTRLLDVLARTGAVLHRDSATLLRRRVEARPRPWPWDAAARERFLGALWRGAATLPALAELDDVGLLTALLPEWEPLRGCPQRNPFHRYSLDRHAWHAAAELAELVRREGWAAETLEEVADRDALMLATLLHDVGKAHGEPHVETGVPVAESVVARLGAGAATRDLVGRLVHLHLLLPDVATRRDLADPALVESVATEVGDRATLACLHLLAVADGLATGPSAWSDWKASLVDALVRKVRAVLDATHPDELADGAAATAHTAQALAPELGVDPATVREHLALLPQRYAASMSPRAVVRHAALASKPLGAVDVHTRVTPAEESEDDDPEPADADTLDLVARDRRGLFAKVAGVLAVHDGSVLAAHAFNREDGLSVDSFAVRRPAGTAGAWWAHVEGDLAEAVAGRLALRARVARRASRRHPRRPADRLPPVQTRVTVAPDDAGRASVVEVRAHDRVGVLFDIATALDELELDIVLAKISTVGHEVVDVFYVRGPDGEPLDDDHAAEMTLAVEAALA